MYREYPNLAQITEYIYKKSPLQKKRIEHYLEHQDVNFKEHADSFFKIFIEYLEKQGLTLEYAVDAYLQICKDTFLEEVKFAKTGKYSLKNAEIAASQVYHNKEVMQYYMYGLAISQFFWKNHYQIYRFFIDLISQRNDDIKKYLEIGPGHGLYLLEAVKQLKQASFKAIDLSDTSLHISSNVIKFMYPEKVDISFEMVDVFEWTYPENFDFLVMGEVLEHVENPVALLKKISTLLHPGGQAFITTCANCPAIDHIYLFSSVEMSRQTIIEGGLKIDKELVLPLEDVTESEWQPPYGKTVNYAAVVSSPKGT